MLKLTIHVLQMAIQKIIVSLVVSVIVIIIAVIVCERTKSESINPTFDVESAGSSLLEQVQIRKLKIINNQKKELSADSKQVGNTYNDQIINRTSKSDRLQVESTFASTGIFINSSRTLSSIINDAIVLLSGKINSFISIIV